MTQTTIKDFSVRVAMMLLMMLLTTATAWAQDKTLSGSESYTAQNGDVLTGSTSGTVTIASGANVTLSDVTITGGIVCSSSATITLVGTNSTTGGYGKAGIQIGGSGTTLTINGDGTLTANGGTDAAGIGLNCAWNVTEDVVGGNIVINGGNITANGGGGGAGIGAGVTKDKNNSSSRKAIVGNITITGGTVTAVGGSNADGIGAGENNYDATIQIGTVTIYDAIEMVDASSIKDFANVVYMHGETNVTASKTDYFTIIEDGDRRIIEKKDNTDYTITIADNSENGTIACAAATAKYGEKITITATPDFGYRLSRLVVKDAQNNNVASTGNSFFMPKSNVTVSAVFEQGVHGTTEFAWGYFGIDGFVNEATIYDGVTTVNIQNTKVSYNILKYEDYTYPKFQLDNDTYYADIPYAGGTGEFYGTGNGTYFSIPYDGETGYYDITMTDVGNGKWNVSILKTAAQMDVVPEQTYTGSAITPEPLVMAGSLNLTKGTDYVYSYTNNTNAGTAKVRATFQGDYASLGYVEKEFTIVFDPADISVNAAGTEYTIHTAGGWNAFCDLLAANTKGYFSGKTVKLDADITVSRMAGSSQHDFTGTFDGDGHTLTVDYIATEQYAAPFRNVESGCVIENLHVTGTIATSSQNAAGIAAYQFGTVIIRNCRSSVNIQSSVSGDGTHGGLVAVKGNSNSAHLTIEGCVFDGKIVSTGTGDAATTKCGGFVGWRKDNGSLTIRNSLYAPQADDNAVTDGATFARNGGTISNCYYTAALGAAQGTAAYVYTPAAEGLVPQNVGAEGTDYSESGITAYASGLKYNGKFYLVKAAVSLVDNADNSGNIVNNQVADVTLSDRTLYKDGAWNTLCLPFDLELSGSVLDGDDVDVRTLAGSDFSSGTLTLDFTDKDAVTTLEAGKPYIISWTKPDGYVAYDGTNAAECSDLVNPVFTGVTVSTATANVETDCVDFIGTLSSTVLYEDGAEKTNLYMGSANKLYYPTVEGFRLNACRGYFKLKGVVVNGNGNDNGNENAIRSFDINFGDDATGIVEMRDEKGEMRNGYGYEDGGWYTVDGRRLDGKPARRGLYIHNGHKVVVQ